MKRSLKKKKKKPHPNTTCTPEQSGGSTKAKRAAGKRSATAARLSNCPSEGDKRQRSAAEVAV